MNPRNLAPLIQEQILARAENLGTQISLPEGALRRISGILDWREQIRRFEELCSVESARQGAQRISGGHSDPAV